jgi:hypothetical protein
VTSDSCVRSRALLEQSRSHSGSATKYPQARRWAVWLVVRSLRVAPSSALNETQIATVVCAAIRHKWALAARLAQRAVLTDRLLGSGCTAMASFNIFPGFVAVTPSCKSHAPRMGMNCPPRQPFSRCWLKSRASTRRSNVSDTLGGALNPTPLCFVFRRFERRRLDFGESGCRLGPTWSADCLIPSETLHHWL